MKLRNVAIALVLILCGAAMTAAGNSKHATEPAFQCGGCPPPCPPICPMAPK